MRLPDLRLPGIDALKGLACALIVWHHLAFYGPMSDVVHAAWPGLISWLYDYGRMAVQVFLVLGGFLAARALAPHGSASFTQAPGRLIFRRYGRLMRPYLVALAVSVLVAALLRPWFAHPSVPAAPSLAQLVGHALLLQDVLGQEALSAGVWYVAIDFQLFALSVAVLALARGLRQRWPQLPAQLDVGLLLLLALASLLFFNRQPGLDMTGLYFLGAYALGMMACWASTMPSQTARRQWLLAMAWLGAAALLLDFRGRLLLAVAVAFGLVWLQTSALFQFWREPRWLARLGQISYSVFLIHFPVCLLANAGVSHFWPTHLAANALGMLAAFLLSLLAGALLYRSVESRPLRAGSAARAGVSIS
ncbi:acyltransferase [Polaromonas sp.]|uniref:acyltransferase family protein n=1 Tax=Polaromonas sp. TaxID=1869339 RepID=UPI00286AFF45|nr:acyltransferase [Polaromonas sp.]